MRLSMSWMIPLCSVAGLCAADLGSPVPIPTEAMPLKEHEKGVPSSLLAAPSASQAQLAPCDCPAGVCPLCPASSQAAPPAVAYRLVWVRGQGWAWMEQPAASAQCLCSGGVCPLPGRSK